MSKRPITSVISNISTAASPISENFAAVEEAFENTISRDGSTPNQMEADFDLNDNDILNVNEITVKKLTLGRNDITSLSVVDVLGAASDAEQFASDAQQSAIDANNITATLSKLQYNTREDFVSAISTTTFSDNDIVFAEGRAYQYVGILYTLGPPDLPGFKPVGDITYEHFGAVGDAALDNPNPTDDREACQAAIDYLKNNSLLFWQTDSVIINTSGQFSSASIEGADGKIYGLSGPLTHSYHNRNMVFERGSFSAIGDDWDTTDFMFSPETSSSTRVTYQDVQLYGAHKCSGVRLSAYSRFNLGKVYNMAGVGIKLDGVNAWAVEADIKEWQPGEAEFFDYTNYTSIGILFSHTDCLALNCLVHWCHTLVDGDAPVVRVFGGHYNNGMEEFAANNGTPRPGGGLGFRIRSSGTGINHPGILKGVYIDNCRVDLDNEPFLFDGCFHVNLATANPADFTAIYHAYPTVQDAIARFEIRNSTILIRSFQPLNWINFKQEGDLVWDRQLRRDNFEGLDTNDADTLNKSFNFGSRRVEISEFEEWLTVYGLSDQTCLRYVPFNSSGPVDFGAENDDAFISAPGNLVNKSSSFRQVPGDTPNVLLDGQMWYDQTDNVFKFRQNGQTVTFATV